MINFMKVNFYNSDCNIVNDGKTNMTVDMELLDFAIKNKIDYGILRFYQWYPKCISLGRNQKADEYNVKNPSLDIVVRPTGGRALLHDRELTYCFVSKILDDSVIKSYKIISDAIICGFLKLGIELEYSAHKNQKFSYCMNISSGADISYKGKKFIGSAQYRKNGYLLQHGSIPYTLDFDLIEKFFNEKTDRDKIITLNEINPNFSTREIIEALKAGFVESFAKIKTTLD